MRLLDRYLFRELLAPLSYCLAGFLIFWVSLDVLSDLDDFREQGLGAAEVARLYLFRLPELLNVVLPVTLLLALLYALGQHNRHHEIVAMRSAGISLPRLSLPYLAVGAGCSLLLLGANEWWLPRAAARSEELAHRYKPGREQVEQLVFFNARDNRNWNIRRYYLREHRMEQPRFEWVLPDGSRRQVLAASAHWTNGQWVFIDAREFFYPAGPGALPVPSQTNRLALPGLSETPESIRSEIKVSSLDAARASRRVTLSLQEIANYRRLHPRMPGRIRSLLETQFHARLASPWTCLVVVLVAVPFGAMGGAGKKNVFVSTASSVFIGFAYFMLMRLGLALGTGGKLPGWVAAWAPNLAFALTGLVLAWRGR